MYLEKIQAEHFCQNQQIRLGNGRYLSHTQPAGEYSMP